MVDEEPEPRTNKTPQNPKASFSHKQPEETIENGQKADAALFSPRFRSVAAMAGWDEEALLVASLVVEDTPDRQFKQKKRPDLQHLKTPPTHSRRKRRVHRRSPVSIPVTVLNLDEDENTEEEIEKTKKIGVENNEKSGIKCGDAQLNPQGSDDSSSTTVIPCIDKLREELSCAICLEICFEPSTTTCGHSFCKKCLRSAADKCGKKCPKCRQLISNGRSCTVNTVLWNTIQLLFPQEVEARKAAAAAAGTTTSDSREPPCHSRSRESHSRTIQALNGSPESETGISERRRRRSRHHNMRTRSVRPSGISSRRIGGGEGEEASVGGVRRRGELPSQDEDAALALRLQREEFMDAFRSPGARLAMARANLRAMASRAIDIRIRGRPS